MPYQERRAIVSLVTTFLVSLSFFIYLFPRYPTGNPYSADIFRFWGLAIMLSIPLWIGVNIAITIVFSIIYAIVMHETVSFFSDERDKLIELRATQNALLVVIGGFFLAMGSLVIDMPPSVMFLVLIVSGYGSGMASSISQIYFSRRGF
jgi:hypothetical protein